VEFSRDRDKKGTADRHHQGESEAERAALLDAHVVEVFKTFLDGAKSRGFDVEEALASWTSRFVKELPSEVRLDFENLCRNGCHPIALAALASFLRYTPRLESIVEVISGPADERIPTARKLEKAAHALASVGELTRSIDEETFDGIGRVHPQKLISELLTQAQLMKLPSDLSKFTGVQSATAFARYLLIKYVERATGSPRDKKVSGLITDLFDDAEGIYSEENQRMWRHRHRDLDVAVGPVIDTVIAVSTVLRSPADWAWNSGRS
jgi:hypothetical protein